MIPIAAVAVACSRHSRGCCSGRPRAASRVGCWAPSFPRATTTQVIEMLKQLPHHSVAHRRRRSGQCPSALRPVAESGVRPSRQVLAACALLTLVLSVRAPSQALAPRLDGPWPGSGSVALGITASTPGGPGLTLDIGIAGPLSAHGRMLGLLWGTVARGAGLGVDLLRSDMARVYGTALVGEIR